MSLMLEGRRIIHGGLRRFWEDDDQSKVDPRWRRKVRRILNALDVAISPVELDIPGFGFHPLAGDRRGTYALSLSRNWRLTFKWSNEGHPYDVDMEDYHGR